MINNPVFDLLAVDTHKWFLSRLCGFFCAISSVSRTFWTEANWTRHDFLAMRTMVDKMSSLKATVLPSHLKYEKKVCRGMFMWYVCHHGLSHEISWNITHVATAIPFCFYGISHSDKPNQNANKSRADWRQYYRELWGKMILKMDIMSLNLWD